MLLALTATVLLATGEPAPVLVELFTSEGCSSCPPADLVLQRLVGPGAAAGPKVIGLSEHVDYWNSLGWRDPFSDPLFSERQERYARRLGAGSYTPEAVIDGTRGVVGSREREIREAVAEATRRPKGRVELSLAGGGQLQIAADWPGGAAEVYLAVTEAEVSSAVTAGENRGERLTHANVVRHLVRVGSGASSFSGKVMIPGAIPARGSLVVFAQSTDSGSVVAVGELPVTTTPRERTPP
jgi:hypothetical protein